MLPKQKISVFSSDNKSTTYNNTPFQPSILPFDFSTAEAPSFKQAR